MIAEVKVNDAQQELQLIENDNPRELVYSAANHGTGSDNFEIKATIYPDSRHIGQAIRIFVVAMHAEGGDNNNVFYKLYPSGQWQAISKPTETSNYEELLPAYQNIIAAESHAINIFSGNIPITGGIGFFFGYSQADGAVKDSLIINKNVPVLYIQ